MRPTAAGYDTVCLGSYRWKPAVARIVPNTVTDCIGRHCEWHEMKGLSYSNKAFLWPQDHGLQGVRLQRLLRLLEVMPQAEQFPGPCSRALRQNHFVDHTKGPHTARRCAV